MSATRFPAGFLLAVVVLCGQTGVLSPDTQRKLSDAAGLARAHQFAEAERLLEGVPVPEDRAQAVAFYRLHAAIDSGLERPEQASQDMHTALRLSPTDSGLSRATAVADLQLAESQLRSGNARAALASAARAKDLEDTGNVEALLGEIQESVGDSIAAVKSFETAVRLAPESERFRLDLALELVAHQTYQPALTVLERSVNDLPQSARIHTALGLTLFLSGREQEAAAEVLKAIALDAHFVPAVRYLGEIGLSGAEPPARHIIEAECRYADEHPKDSESNASCGALEARIAAADPATANWVPILRRLASAAEASPENVLAHCEYGKALEQKHDLPRARTELETCARLNPDSVEVHYRLARLYRALGLTEKARRELALRSAAERRLAASNEARQRSVQAFLYSMKEQ